jgi:hypothetical protein
MPGIVVLQGPDAPADAPLGFCAVCAALGKFEAIAPIRGAIEAHERGGQGVRRWGLAVPREYLNRGVTFGVIPSMQAAGPVCWSHLIALQPSSGGIIPAAPGLPGLPNGGQGIPLLGGG